MRIAFSIDGTQLEAEAPTTILEAAWNNEIYIPSLCAHPDLPPQRICKPAEAIYLDSERLTHDGSLGQEHGCGICVVEVQGVGQVRACSTEAQDGMAVVTTGTLLEQERRTRLSELLANHPHACLTCAQREGCAREPCSMGVPVAQRCCALLGNCELEALAKHVGIEKGTRRYVPTGMRVVEEEPLFARRPDLCVACTRCVRVCELRGVSALGWVRDPSGCVRVGLRGATAAQAGCQACGSCVEVCPTGALTDRNLKRAEREQALVPCRSACPAGTDVPRYVRLAAKGSFLEAARVVAERAPLVEVLGQVCFHPCEQACRRREVDGASVAICGIKREVGAASGAAWAQNVRPTPNPAAKRVAVVGAGPAGLVAAHVLSVLGHRVVLLEAEARLGGMLAYAIPSFRLSQEAVSREAAALVRHVEVRTGVRVGHNGLSVARLRDEHDAVVLATGASQSVRLGVPGEDLPGVFPGLAFLRRLAEAELDAGAFSGRRVVVVGGGNVAVDCARSARRLGSKQVELVCLEQPDALPAYREEVEQAVAEGVLLAHGWGVAALQGSGALAGVRLKRCLRVLAADGSFAPEYDDTEQREVAAEVLIVAAGQRPDTSFFPEEMAGVSLAGDLADGPNSVVEAVASGREVALATDRFLGGAGKLNQGSGCVGVGFRLEKLDGFLSLPRHDVGSTTVEGCGPEALPASMGPENARREAARCLRCDLRLQHRKVPRPPTREARLQLDEESLVQVPACEGVVQFFAPSGELLEVVGGPDMREEVRGRLDADRAAWFTHEPCALYTQRQNELLSHYMEIHGRTPPGVREEDDLDDLF